MAVEAADPGRDVPDPFAVQDVGKLPLVGDDLEDSRKFPDLFRGSSGVSSP